MHHLIHCLRRGTAQKKSEQAMRAPESAILVSFTIDCSVVKFETLKEN
jgi:hypothetical protein